MSAVNPARHYPQPRLVSTCPSCGESVRASDTSCEFCFATFPKQEKTVRASTSLPGPRRGLGWKLWCVLACLLATVVWMSAVFTLGMAGFSYVTTKNPHFAQKIKQRITLWQCRRAETDPATGATRLEVKMVCDYMETGYRKRYGSPR